MNPDYNITQEELEYIERYITKNMTFEELAAFEEKLRSNPDFKNQVDDIKTMLLGIETQALKEKLDEFHKELPETNTPIEEPSKIRYLNIKKLIAIAAVFVISLGSYWFFNKESHTNLYSKYYSPDPGLPTTMSSSDNFIFYDAMVNYKRKDYNLAISKWEPLLIKKPENDTLNYFIGSAYLANDKEELAMTYLQKVTQLKENTFKNEAYYYLGLAYLKAKNIELAKKYLNLSTFDNSKEILSKLKE
ncbi:tetratricopeptide repeat protein [Xanthomarina sp. F2636L]|uniref:tetratricopeptide repeat protein n=1 Tax=Xanthomarina sp. F2636L TaxID=2996018 RepID=UPI00225DCE6B|nr:hypothetical protein [Xanthomarina sp. F2636L]MCX7550803.1 hypothetical protein [Xanthomarina sp. F2636L]